MSLKNYKFCFGNFKNELSEKIIPLIINIPSEQVFDLYNFYISNFNENYDVKTESLIHESTEKLKYDYKFSDEISLGIDIPTYFGNIDDAKEKIMIIAMDPKRNHNDKIISIGTPFALDNEKGRTTKQNVYWEFVENLIENNFIYLTDVFKLYFKKGNKNSNELNNYTDLSLHLSILDKEISLVKPDKIIVMGSKPWHYFSNLYKNDLKNKREDNHGVRFYFKNEIEIIKVPHLSGRNLQSLKTIGELLLTYGEIFNLSDNIISGEKILSINKNKKELFTNGNHRN